MPEPVKLTLRFQCFRLLCNALVYVMLLDRGTTESFGIRCARGAVTSRLETPWVGGRRPSVDFTAHANWSARWFERVSSCAGFESRVNSVRVFAVSIRQSRELPSSWYR